MPSGCFKGTDHYILPGFDPPMKVEGSSFTEISFAKILCHPNGLTKLCVDQNLCTHLAQLHPPIWWANHLANTHLVLASALVILLIHRNFLELESYRKIKRERDRTKENIESQKEKTKHYWRGYPIISETRLGEISPLWNIVKELWPFWKLSFCIWHYFELILANFICNWANFYCWKMQKY